MNHTTNLCQYCYVTDKISCIQNYGMNRYVSANVYYVPSKIFFMSQNFSNVSYTFQSLKGYFV